MNVITLISDWKLRDPYVGVLKGRLLSKVKDAQIVDITHSIDRYNIMQTAFILKSAYSSFPEGTLHVILTDLVYAEKELPVLVSYDGHYFLGRDNGIFTLMFGMQFDAKAYQYEETKDDGRIIDRIIEMAALFSEGNVDKHCKEYSSFVKKIQQEADYSLIDNRLTGQVVYLDSSCNAITNIPVELFMEARGKKNFSATFNSGKGIHVTRFHDHYNAKENEFYLVNNKLGYIELTISYGNAAALIGLNVGDKVSIDFD